METFSIEHGQKYV